MGRSKDIASGSKFVDTAGDTMTGNLGVGGAANGSYAITSYSSAGQNLRLENDGEVGFIRLEDDGDLNIWAHGDENIGFMNGTGSGTTRMNIDGSGHVTMINQPAFSVRSNGGTSGNTWQQDNVIKFQTVAYNKGSNYSTTTGRFTAPVNGYYVFHYTGFGYNGGRIAAGQTTSVQFRINGSGFMVIYDNTDTGATYPSTTGSGGFFLNASDYVDIYTSGQGQYADQSNLYTQWSGYLLG